jgi:hypothetical protein
MNNRFASQFMAGLSPQVKAILPPQQLDSLLHNPQALFNTGATDQLKSFFEQLGPQGAVLFDQLIQTLKSALNSSITEVFFIALILVAVGWVVNLFLKEIPLRKQHV